MSSPSNIGSYDLESVLNVARRRLQSISEINLSPLQYRYADTIHLKRQCNSNTLFSIDSKILIFGELQLLFNIFERYKSTITVYENAIERQINERKLSNASKGNENVDENDKDPSTVVETKHQADSSSTSLSTLKVPEGSTINKTTISFGRTRRSSSINDDYTLQRLEGKYYGCIELPNMNLIEILEILFRNGLELAYESNDYDKENVFHQNFIFSKPLQLSQRLGQQFHSRRPSFMTN